MKILNSLTDGLRMGGAVLGFTGMLLAIPAQAIPTLTAAGNAEGFTLSQFADNFPIDGNPCCGPLGIAFDNGKVIVTDAPGNVRIFATDTDGQHADTVAPAASYGSRNAVGLARLGNFLYTTSQALGTVRKLNLDGTFVSTVVTGIPSATGIAANPINGKLYVSDCCSGTGIYQVDPVTNTKTVFKTGSFDGLTVSADGLTLYAEFASSIRGYRISDGVEVFNSGVIAGGPDGAELGSGTLAGKLFVNANNGTVYELSLANPLDIHAIVTGGTRGDFVTADPNGSLLFTQTSDIWRLTPGAGGCIGANCNNVPEPASLMLLAVGLAGLRRYHHKKAI